MAREIPRPHNTSVAPMHQRRTIGLLVSASFVVASCGGGPVEEAASGPQFIRSEASSWADAEGDGFNHLVIDLTALDLPRPAPSPTVPTTTAIAYESGDLTAGDGYEAESAPPQTATTILPIGSDESVYVYSEPDGSLWALLENGDRVPVALGREGLIFAPLPEDELPAEAGVQGGGDGESPPPETTSTTAPPPPPPPEEPAIVLELRADPDVESIVALGDGTWSVVTTLSAEQLEARTGQPARSDVLLGLATDDRHYSEQWALENLGDDGIADADIDHEGTRGITEGDGVVVAVIDTGIDFSHPELLPARWSNEDETSCTNGLDDDGNGFVDDCHGWDFVNGDPTGYDLNAHWHGTHVAGIIVAATDNQTGIAGIAPQARVMDLRVVDQFETGAATVAAAIRYAVDNGADIINLSLSTPPGEVDEGDVADLAAALDHALAHDVVVVSAAGNEATNIDDRPVWPASFSHPNLITVAASTRFDSGASFSNTGPDSVDLFAPGADILSTSPGGRFRRADGTSIAAPHVAGTAALVRAAVPALDAAGVRDRILATVDVGSGFTRGSLTGGRLNAAAAVAGGPGPKVSFEFAGLDGAAAETDLAITITTTVADSSEFEGYELGWAATLATRIDDNTYVLVDHGVSTAAGPGQTGEDGRIILSAPAPAPAGPIDLSLTTQLPAGRYALIVETTVGGRPELLIGTPGVELFTVTGGEASTDPASESENQPPDGPSAVSPDDPAPDPSGLIDAPPPEPVPEPEPTPVSFPIVNGEWRIDSLSPPVGSVGGGGHVTITGNFPDATFVWIGDTPVNVLAVSSQQLLAEIPRRSEPGQVDISLRTSADGIVLEAPGVFTFLGENDSGLADPAPEPVAPIGGGNDNELLAPGGSLRPPYELGEPETRGPLTLAPIDPGSLVWLDRIWGD